MNNHNHKSKNFKVKKKKKNLNQLEPKPVKKNIKKSSNLNNNGLNRKNKTERRKKLKNKNNEIWFDGVDECLIRAAEGNSNSNSNSNKLVKDKSYSGMTRIVAMDCEMVGVGYDGDESMLARVSIVNYFGHCIYDKYVKPMEDVTDFRTHVSGIRPSDYDQAEEFRVVQREVGEILRDRIVVGHALRNDFKVLYFSHPKDKIRDTSKYFKKLLGGRTPSLKKLCQTYLGVSVQTGEHDSVQDAQAAMRLYTLYRKKWEALIKKKNKKRHFKKKKSK